MLDPTLPWLERALSPESAGPAVLAALAAVTPLPAATRVVAATLRRHKPGRRALISYRLVDPRSGSVRSLLGKIRRAGLDTRTVSVVRHFAGVGTPDEPAAVPRVLGLIPEWHCWLQEEVVGRPGFLALAGRDGPEAAFRIGAALALLHQRGPGTDRTHPLAAELRALEQRFQALATTAPDLASRLHDLLSAVTTLAADLDDCETVGLHRDFYPDQVLVGARVYLLDLDLYAMGHPALDLGNFLAHLFEFDLRTARRRAPLSDLAPQFLAGYGSVRPLPANRDIARFELLTLARHVALSRSLVGREHTTIPLLEECRRRTGELLCGPA